MSLVPIAILGAASVRYALPVIATLATFAGERHLEIRFADADEERLDLFDRVARTGFLASNSTHRLLSTPDFREALEDVVAAVVCFDSHGARKYLKGEGVPPSELDRTDDQLVHDASHRLEPPTDGIDLLVLLDALRCPEAWDRWRSDWLPEPQPELAPAVPHRALRLIRGEEPFFELTREYQGDNPLRKWLERVSSSDRASTQD